MHIVNTVKHRCEDMDKAVNKYIPFIEKKLYDKSEFSRRDLSSSAGMSGQQRPGHILVTSPDSGTTDAVRESQAAAGLIDSANHRSQQEPNHPRL